jgi:putative ABC transport system permease protein
MLRRLPAIPHVQSVVPEVDFYGRALLNYHAEKVLIHSSPPDRVQLLGRVVAGRFLRAGEADAVVVTEYLLYLLGIVDDEAVQGVLGQKLRLEYQTGTTPSALSMLSGLSGIPMTPDKQRLLDKIAKQLPAAVDRLDLTPNEKEVLRKTLLPTDAGPTQVRTVGREFTIVGVLRGASERDLRNGNFDWWLGKVDVVLPVPSALELYFEAAAHREYGLNQVMVEVDSPEHVKEAAQAIDALGLNTITMKELIERHQFAYLLLFAGMACIAVVALLMAALGIINTMLMSVLERRREIGVMKALGARNSHIQSIFLFEGALLGLTGALLGLLAGWAVSLPGDAWVRSFIASRLQIEPQESVFVWPAWLLLGTPLFACLVTTLAAVYPARRAARVDPITVLRME